MCWGDITHDRHARLRGNSTWITFTLLLLLRQRLLAGCKR
jgi:hypothetical protein